LPDKISSRVSSHGPSVLQSISKQFSRRFKIL
jgi:hypothetical protein